MTEQIILTQIQQLPESLKKEVLDFIGYLLEKHNRKKPTASSDRKQATGAGSGIEEAIRIVQAGCDMGSFGDALEFQQTARQERKLPYRD
jgi:hypothetical protein